MLGKAVAVATMVATGVLTVAPPGHAGTRTAPSQSAPAGWYDTNANAAQSRSNPAEKILSSSNIAQAKYLRTIVSPPDSPKATCGQQPMVAPLPYGNALYAVADGQLSKYNPATGAVVWQHPLNSTNIYTALDISGNVLVVAGTGCQSASQPGGAIGAYNATTGAKLWFQNDPDTLDDAVKVGSYIIAAGEDAAGYSATVFNLTNGKTVWSHYGCTGFGSPLALVVGSVVMTYGCDHSGNTNVVARNLTTGAQVWSLPGNWTLQRGDLSGPAGQNLYATNPAGVVEDLNPATGQAKYSLTGAKTVLAVDSARVYASCDGQNVCAYDITTGAQLWKVASPYYSPTKLAAEANGVLYLDSGIALNASTGQKLATVWSTDYGYLHTTQLAIGDGRIVVSTDPRTLDLYGLAGS
jgi:hypothetical protein